MVRRLRKRNEGRQASDHHDDDDHHHHHHHNNSSNSNNNDQLPVPTLPLKSTAGFRTRPLRRSARCGRVMNRAAGDRDPVEPFRRIVRLNMLLLAVVEAFLDCGCNTGPTLKKLKKPRAWARVPWWGDPTP